VKRQNVIFAEGATFQGTIGIPAAALKNKPSWRALYQVGGQWGSRVLVESTPRSRRQG